MTGKIFVCLLATVLLTTVSRAEAQQTKVYRVGVIFHGGEWNAVVAGLRDGLRELGLEERKHVVLEIRDTKGDVNGVDEAARNLERDKLDLLYAIATSVTISHHSSKRGNGGHPHRFLRRGRPSRRRARGQFRETRGQAYGRALLDNGPYGEAS